jgi:tRNA(His) 5'-end guanylyltransferase
MIKHIVVWRLKQTAQATEMKQKLEGLKNLIHEIQNLEVGININHSSESKSDIVLITRFNSLNELNQYIHHPEHQKVAQWIKTLAEERRVIDFQEEA